MDHDTSCQTMAILLYMMYMYISAMKTTKMRGQPHFYWKMNKSVANSGVVFAKMSATAIPVSSKGPEFQPDLKYQPAAETENSGGK